MPTVVYVEKKNQPRLAFSQKILTPRQINPYMSNPCHIELILTEAEEVVQKSDAVAERDQHLSSRQRGARLRKAITAA